MHRRSFLGILSAVSVGTSQTDIAVANRPRVPGAVRLRARRRADQAPSNKSRVSENVLRWEVA